MPQVIFTSGALQDIKYCRSVLELKSPEAAFRSQQVIQQRFLLLETMPLIGRVFFEFTQIRVKRTYYSVWKFWLCCSLSLRSRKRTRFYFSF